MKCIYCNKKGTEVSDTRETVVGVRRRRSCLHCGARFTTTELSLSENLFVKKRSNTKQRFNRDKLFVSIFTVLDGGKGRDNGDLAKKSRLITNLVCKKITQENQRVIPSSEITKLVYTELSQVAHFYGQKYMLYSPNRVKVLSE